MWSLQPQKAWCWFGWPRELQHLECQSQVVVRLCPEDRPQTPTEHRALYKVLSVCFVQLIRLPPGMEAFQKQMSLPPKGSLYTHKTKCGQVCMADQKEQGVSAAFVSKADQIKAVSHYNWP
jgi:hypothetical protein